MIGSITLLKKFTPHFKILDPRLETESYESSLLRSTKWNANLILLRDYTELVALCKVIVWKTHIPVRTQK